jgi:hypothetical protein
MTRRDTPHTLACELRRLWPDYRKPHIFDDAKRDLAARIAALELPGPCALCAVASLRHALGAARQTTRAAILRAEKAERLLASARPPRPRPRRRAFDPRQMELCFR